MTVAELFAPLISVCFDPQYHFFLEIFIWKHSEKYVLSPQKAICWHFIASIKWNVEPKLGNCLRKLKLWKSLFFKGPELWNKWYLQPGIFSFVNLKHAKTDCECRICGSLFARAQWFFKKRRLWPPKTAGHIRPHWKIHSSETINREDKPLCRVIWGHINFDDRGGSGPKHHFW